MEFARIVIDALDATEVDYLIGDAVAVWAWGELRTTRDLDIVVNLPGTRIVQLSEELSKRKMLVPAEIIIDLLIQPEGDLPINAIHLDTGYKAEIFLLRDGDVYREMSLSRRRLVDFGPPLGNVYVHAPEDFKFFMGLDAIWKFSVQDPRDLESYGSGFKVIDVKGHKSLPVITASVNENV